MSTIAALLHLTIPRESNNFKARLLHSHILLFIAGAFAILQFAILHTPSIPIKEPSVLGYASQISLDDVVRFTNQKRAASGLPALTTNASLSKAALAKGRDMLAKGYWAHVAPDGTEPWDFFKQVNYKYRFAGENLARDFSSASSAVDAWMASPSHRENMLSPKYKDIGVAVVEGNLNGQDTTIIVQLFGTLASEAETLPSVSAKTAEENPIPEVKAAQPTAVPLPQNEVLTGFASNIAEHSFDISRAISLGLLIAMSVLFIIDAIVTFRRSLVRGSGRPIAHLSFLGVIILIVAILKAGQIL